MLGLTCVKSRERHLKVVGESGHDIGQSDDHRRPGHGPAVLKVALVPVGEDRDGLKDQSEIVNV